MSYFDQQARLLLEVLGTVLNHEDYALKGGTAINFFHANMPRLSVDIDLAYTKITSRETFLEENSRFFHQLTVALPKKHPVSVLTQKTQDGIPKQLIIDSKDAQIKVDVNLVLRGTVFPPVITESCPKISQNYGLRHKLKTLSFDDLYAGKFCAALDRQHPRDLFDVMIFFQNHQITENLKEAFLVYLISGGRPISELIQPNRLNQKSLFDKEFAGMTDYDIPYSALEEAREQLISSLDTALNRQDREFLLSFKKREPRWELLNIDHVKDMPAVKWKLHNLEKMDKQKHEKALNELKRKLAL